MVCHWLLILALLGALPGAEDEQPKPPKKHESVTVKAEAEPVDTRSVAVGSHFGPQEIRRIPGAAEGTAAIVALTNTAWVSQEHLHIRGGHQVGYRLDGVEVPELSLFGAVTSFLDPRNFRAVEVTAGGIPAEYGNRTSGIVDAVLRSGFDEVGGHGLLEAAGGSFGQRSLFGAYGDHVGERFAFYLQGLGLGSRRAFNPPPDSLDLPTALRPPTSQTQHNSRETFQGLANLEFRATAADRFRLAAGAYNTDLEIPNTVEQREAGRDYLQRERDRFLLLGWTHAAGGERLLSVSGFHHASGLQVAGVNPPGEDDRRAAYTGLRSSYAWRAGRHLLKAGLESYRARVRDVFLAEGFDSDALTTGWEHSGFVEDQFNATDRLTLHLGARVDHFSARHVDTSVSPRVGFAYRLGRSQAAVFGSYNLLFLPPPLEFIRIPNFDAVRPERDRQYDLGVKFPLRGFQVRLNRWSKRQENFLDHLQFGENNIFLPVNLERARAHGWEAAVAAPRWRGLSAQAQYSLNSAQARGGVVHGYHDFEPPAPGWFFLDHDQRHAVALVAGYDWEKHGASADFVYSYGSGFPGPGFRLLAHHTVNLALAKRLAEKLEARLELENLLDSVYPINLSSEFNGSHYSSPRRAIVRLSWMF